MMKRTQAGFTLVELLVVISIIGVLVGLTIPAVNAARETARKSECANNMKNLALAGFQHEGAKGRLPGWVQSFGSFPADPTAATGVDPSDPGATNPAAHIKLGTWAVALLPWLDAQPTYEHWTEDRYPIISAGGPGSMFTPSPNGFHELAMPNLAIMQCPSNPSSIDTVGRNSYISNNGAVAPSAATFAASMSRANGAFNNKFGGIGTSLNGTAIGPDVRSTDFKDGPGFTMLFSENVQARSWSRAGFITSADVTNPNLAYPPTSRFTSGMVFHQEDDSEFGGAALPLQQHKINGGGATVSDDRFTLTLDNVTTPPGRTPADLARPSSAHVDGVNTAMADGATRYIKSTIDYRVYQALMTLRGKSSSVPFPEFVLTDQLD